MEQIGRYRVVGELGRGAMGVVYRAEDPTIGRTVAIKTIRLGDLADSSEREFMRERLLREARSAGILSHPGIVTIYDISEEGDTAFVFMEYVNGETLEKMVSKSGHLEKDRLFDILRQTAAALDYAHGKGIVHRDIKPANIMISVDGEAKITDFGVAKILSQQMTQTRSVLGTPYYMSPEQIQGGKIDGRSDQFALAVITYELMTGERPYSADSLPTLLFRIVKEMPAPPERVNPSLAPGVGTVLQKAFSKDPDQRYSSTTEFVNAIAMAAGKRPDWQPLDQGGSGALETMATGPQSPVSRPGPVAPPPAAPLQLSGLGGPAPPVPDQKEAAAAPIALPQIPKTRSPDQSQRLRESHLIRNVIIALAVLVLVAGGVYAFLGYYYQQPLAGPGGEADIADVDGAPDQQPPPVSEPPVAAETDTATAAPAAEEGAGASDAIAMAEQVAAAEQQPVAASAPPPEPPPAQPPAEVRAPPTEPAPAPTPAPTSQRVTEHWVQIRSSPPGATVNADKDPELTCRTPCELPLKTGRHVLSVEMAGHRLTPRIIRVPDTTDLTIRLEQMAGTLAIATTPAGATIFINGEERREKTPAMVKLPVGRYHIRLVLPGRPDFEDTVEVRDQVIMRVGVDW